MARLQLENVSVEYPIYNARSQSLRNHIVAAGVGGRLARQALGAITVRALDGVTLDLRNGDRIGLVGHNGSGKTTLLRTMARIFAPTSGRINVSGKVSTVFGLGAGAEPELSGHENIVRMSMLLGATLAQAKASIAEIDEFAELGEFLAVPIRTYSAGMLTRLMFAVATAVNPDILLVDEVMGAADQNFQRKARKRMGEFIERSSIFVLASHTEELLKLYCNKIYTLSHGRLLAVS
jgi:ABC-type polysaccharide/polyol phosphate transport system ATPase subunit